MRQLKMIFQEPGLLEVVVVDPLGYPESGLQTAGYRSVWVADLMVDFDLRTDKPYAFMVSSFDKTYPLIIWALKIHMADEYFDVPQAQLKSVPLHEAFSWAYTHFILEDHLPSLDSYKQSAGPTFASKVLQYAAVA